MKLIAFVAVVVIGTLAHATDYLDFLNPQTGTQAVALTGGDTPSTYQVSCSSNTLAAGATLLLAAVGAGVSSNATQGSGRPLRKRCFQNSSSVKVNIGSSTVAASDYFQLSESSGTYATYCTQNSGAFYCAPALGNGALTVNVLQETQSQP